MLGILGTQLRMTCACHGTEFPHLYECLGWQRLLWLNPCVGKWNFVQWFSSSRDICMHVTRLELKCDFFLPFYFAVEAQKDFHVKRLAELGLLTTTSTTTTRSPPIVVLTTNRISLGINEPFNTKHHPYTPVSRLHDFNEIYFQSTFVIDASCSSTFTCRYFIYIAGLEDNSIIQKKIPNKKLTF